MIGPANVVPQQGPVDSMIGITTAGPQHTGWGAGTHAGGGQLIAGAEAQRSTVGLQQPHLILLRSQPAEAGLPLSKTVSAITSDHWEKRRTVRFMVVS